MEAFYTKEEFGYTEALVHKYFKLWKSFFANSLTRDMEFKANLLGGVAVDVVFYCVQYFFFSIIYSYVDALGSFTREDVLIFLIITFLADTIYMLLFSGNLFSLNRLVVQGDLDFVLLKPINSQFFVSFRFVRSYALISIFFLTMILIRQCLIHSQHIEIINFLYFLISFTLGALIWYSIDFMIACLTFWFKNFTVGGWLSHELLKFSARPDTIYTGLVRKLLFSFIPMALISSVPARMLIYGFNLELLILQIMVATIMIFTTILVWKRGLLRYESASS